jgi:hypothetical protein
MLSKALGLMWFESVLCGSLMWCIEHVGFSFLRRGQSSISFGSDS